VNGETDATRERAVSMIRMRPGSPTWQAITDGRWRATINADTGQASELFDLDTDPDEAHNLVDDPTAGDVLGHLTNALAASVGTV